MRLDVETVVPFQSEAEISSMNKRLILRFGMADWGQPKFRISWGPDQFETRCGEYNEFWGEIFIRTTIGSQRVPKYPQESWGACYILEQCLPIPIHHWGDFGFAQKVSWEPLYVFRAANNVGKYEVGDPLPVLWSIVEYAVDKLVNRNRIPKRTESDDRADDAKLFKKNVEFNMAYLENQGSAMHGAFTHGSAVVNPHGETKYGGKSCLVLPQ